MNILFSSLSGHDLTQSRHYVRVLERLGHKVFCFSTPSSKDERSQGYWTEPGYAYESNLDSLVRLANFTPDLFLYIEPNGLIPRGMEHALFPTACIISDMHRDLGSRLRLIRFFDHVFLYHRNYLQYASEHPREFVHWHPYACDLELFRPLDVERDLDVAFVGLLKPGSGREALLARLSARFKMNEFCFYHQQEIPGVYSRAKIVLNLPLSDDLNFRTFEAMSCGAMLLTRRVNNGQELLFQEGKHFAAFADERELFEKIEYYLAHLEEREKIAQAGLAEMRQNHRLEQRLEQMLEAVQDNPGQAAPVRHMSTAQIDRQYAWLYEYWRRPEAGLQLAREARSAGRAWMPLLLPAARSVLRVLFR